MWPDLNSNVKNSKNNHIRDLSYVVLRSNVFDINFRRQYAEIIPHFVCLPAKIFLIFVPRQWKETLAAIDRSAPNFPYQFVLSANSIKNAAGIIPII